MDTIEWNESLSIGIELIDQQHKTLIERLLAVTEAIEKNQGEGTIAKTLDFLLEYIDLHFSTEEKQMAEHNYPGLDLQKQQHAERDLEPRVHSLRVRAARHRLHYRRAGQGYQEERHRERHQKDDPVDSRAFGEHDEDELDQ